MSETWATLKAAKDLCWEAGMECYTWRQTVICAHELGLFSEEEARAFLSRSF